MLERVRAAMTAPGSRFAEILYAAAARRAGDGNVLVAPENVADALFALAAGACGNTMTQMCQVLGIDVRHRRAMGLLDPALDVVSDLLNEPAPPHPEAIRSGCALWAWKGLPLAASYRILASNLGMLIERFDAGVPGANAHAINKWAREATNGAIDRVVAPEDLRGAYALLLTAVYFSDSWARAFDPARTTEVDFRSPSGPIRAPMMRQKGEFEYCQYSGSSAMAEAVRLPFSSNDRHFEMWLFLPQADTPLGLVESDIAAIAVAGDFRPLEMNLEVPAMRVGSALDLKGILMAMGMVDPFRTSMADFGNINTNLYLDDIRHQVGLRVDEAGAEFAAVTRAKLAVRCAAAPVPTVRFDRPFHFRIVEADGGRAHLMGRITNPNGN